MATGSQTPEDWIPVPDHYDDGGFSGGNMDRPALHRLMADIEAGRVDIVVVYKIDRLSRSLGYDVGNRLRVINEREAAIVRRIFDDFVTVRSATMMVRNYASDPQDGGRKRRTGTKNLFCCEAYCSRPMVNG